MHKKLISRFIDICNRSRFKGSGVQKFHLLHQTEFKMRIYEKSVSFVRPNPKFGDKLAIIWENAHI